MHSYCITSAVTITEMAEDNPQITIDETVWHMALRVVKIFNVTSEDSNRVATVRFMRSCYPEMNIQTTRIIVHAAIYAVTNKTHTPEHL